MDFKIKKMKSAKGLVKKKIQIVTYWLFEIFRVKVVRPRKISYIKWQSFLISHEKLEKNSTIDFGGLHGYISYKN